MHAVRTERGSPCSGGPEPRHEFVCSVSSRSELGANASEGVKTILRNQKWFVMRKRIKKKKMVLLVKYLKK